MNKTGLKWGHLKHVHVSEQVPPKCLHAKACRVGSKHEELETCALLQGWDLAGIPEPRWRARTTGVLRQRGTGSLGRMSREDKG